MTKSWRHEAQLCMSMFSGCLPGHVFFVRLFYVLFVLQRQWAELANSNMRLFIQSFPSGTGRHDTYHQSGS